MKWIILITLFLSLPAHAEDWFCTTESSRLVGDSIEACGIGGAKDESLARLTAFDMAKLEFNRLCRASDSCPKREVTIVPQRTTCSQVNGKYMCYRMIVFNLGGPRADKDSKMIAGKLEPSNLTKIKRGMSKDELVASFGTPVRVNDLSYGSRDHLLLFFEGKMCVYSTMSCSVTLNKGIVENFDRIKPEVTEEI